MADSVNTKVPTDGTGAPVPTDPTADTNVDTLVKKHRAEIDRIIGLDMRSQEAAFREYGGDPDKLKAFYGELQAKEAELTQRDIKADGKTAITGWLSLIGGAVAAVALRKKISDSKIVQRFAVGLAALGSGLIGTFIGSRAFAGDIREESRQLVVKAKAAFDRELATVIENREIDSQNAAAPEPSGNLAAKVPQPAANYATQAAADKAAANAATMQHT